METCSEGWTAGGRGLFLVPLLGDAGQDAEVPRSLRLHRPSASWRPAPASDMASPASSRRGARTRGRGREPGVSTCISVQAGNKTAHSREVVQETSIKETLSMGAIRLRAPQGRRAPPSPPCSLSYPFRGESRDCWVSSLSSSKSPLHAFTPVL